MIIILIITIGMVIIIVNNFIDDLLILNLIIEFQCKFLLKFYSDNIVIQIVIVCFILNFNIYI